MTRVSLNPFLEVWGAAACLAIVLIGVIVLGSGVVTAHVESHCVGHGVRAYQTEGIFGQLALHDDPTCKKVGK